MAYFGPASAARQYFIDMGYQPANRQTTPDFLVSVTDPDGRNVRASDELKTENGGIEKAVPGTAIEFTEHYRKSGIRERNLRDMEEYKNEFVGKQELRKRYRESSRAEHAKHARRQVRCSFPVSYRDSALTYKVCLESIHNLSLDASKDCDGQKDADFEGKLYGAGSLNNVCSGFGSQGLCSDISITSVFVLQAVIIGTTFARITDATSAYFSRGGVIFLYVVSSLPFYPFSKVTRSSIFAPTLFYMTEIPSLFAQRPIVLRQNQAAMYHPMVEALAMTLVDVPFTLVTMTLFIVVIYFVVGLQTSAWQFLYVPVLSGEIWL